MLAVQSLLKKYFASPIPQIKTISHVVPARWRGVSRSSRTLARNAVDALALQDEWRLRRTVKSCGPDASTPASSLADKYPLGDGDKKARSPGRARRNPLKPLRREMPGVSGGPVVTTRVRLLHFAHEAAGAAGTRHSLRPLFSSGERILHHSDASRRGNALVMPGLDPGIHHSSEQAFSKRMDHRDKCSTRR